LGIVFQVKRNAPADTDNLQDLEFIFDLCQVDTGIRRQACKQPPGVLAIDGIVKKVLDRLLDVAFFVIFILHRVLRQPGLHGSVFTAFSPRGEVPGGNDRKRCPQ
jgi:hypothetical protein